MEIAEQKLKGIKYINKQIIKRGGIFMTMQSKAEDIILWKMVENNKTIQACLLALLPAIDCLPGIQIC